MLWPHRAIVNLLQHASIQCDVGLVRCVSCLNPVCGCWSEVCSQRAIANLLQPALNPVWILCSVCPHRAIANFLQPLVWC